jgi:hypothetical protein
MIRFYSFQNMQIVQNAIFTNANDDFMQFDLSNQYYNSSF